MSHQPAIFTSNPIRTYQVPALTGQQVEQAALASFDPNDIHRKFATHMHYQGENVRFPPFVMATQLDAIALNEVFKHDATILDKGLTSKVKYPGAVLADQPTTFKLWSDDEGNLAYRLIAANDRVCTEGLLTVGEPEDSELLGTPRSQTLPYHKNLARTFLGNTTGTDGFSEDVTDQNKLLYLMACTSGALAFDKKARQALAVDDFAPTYDQRTLSIRPKEKWTLPDDEKSQVGTYFEVNSSTDKSGRRVQTQVLGRGFTVESKVILFPDKAIMRGVYRALNTN